MAEFMKNIVKTFFILIAFFSVIGIVFLGIYYIKKNIALFGKLFNEIVDDSADGELSQSEIEEISDRTVAIIKNIGGDVDSDFAKLKSKAVKIADRVKGKVEVFSKHGSVSKVRKTSNSPAVRKKTINGGLNTRQEDILGFIRSNSNAKMSDVSKLFAQVTPRTLRRDLEKLEQLGFLKQEGKTRDAVYKII